MTNRDMFVSYIYSAAGSWNGPGYGTKVLSSIPPIVCEHDVEFWLEKQVVEDLVETYPDLEDINVVILSWRRMED